MQKPLITLNQIDSAKLDDLHKVILNLAIIVGIDYWEAFLLFVRNENMVEPIRKSQ